MHPDRVPIICERSETSKIPYVDKVKYMVPQDMQAFHFIFMVRKRIKLRQVDSLFFYTNGRNIINANSLMGDIYN